MKERTVAAVGLALVALVGLQGEAATASTSVYEASYWTEGYGVVREWESGEVLHEGSYEDSGSLIESGASSSLSLGDRQAKASSEAGHFFVESYAFQENSDSNASSVAGAEFFFTASQGGSINVSISGYTTPVALSRYIFEVFHVDTGDSIADFSVSGGDSGSYDQQEINWSQSVSFIEGDDYRVFMEVAGSGWEMGPRHRLEAYGLPTATPSPAAGAMMLIGLGGLLCCRRDRKASSDRP